VTPAFVTPYVPIIVAMEEGWFILSNLVGCEDDAVAIGLRVEVVFHSRKYHEAFQSELNAFFNLAYYQIFGIP
jgi:uncharacterized OB-fold protein